MSSGLGKPDCLNVFIAYFAHIYSPSSPFEMSSESKNLIFGKNVLTFLKRCLQICPFYLLTLIYRIVLENHAYIRFPRSSKCHQNQKCNSDQILRHLCKPTPLTFIIHQNRSYNQSSETKGTSNLRKKYFGFFEEMSLQPCSSYHLYRSLEFSSLKRFVCKPVSLIQENQEIRHMVLYICF